jgi:hypothetical protein
MHGKILVARSDVDAWLKKFRQKPGKELGSLVQEIMSKKAARLTGRALEYPPYHARDPPAPPFRASG